MKNIVFAHSTAQNHTQVTIVEHLQNSFEEPNVDVIFPNISVLDPKRLPITELNSLLGSIYHMKKLYDFSVDFYKVPVIIDLYKRKSDFDVVFVDYFFNEVCGEEVFHSVIAKLYAFIFQIISEEVHISLCQFVF